MTTVDDLRRMAEAKLSHQAARAAVFQSCADNDAGIVALLDTEERQTFRTFLSEARANWCELVVSAVSERLQVVGFRFGNKTASDAAWTIWQASAMDADSDLVQTDALTQSSSFVLVQPDDANATGVSITPESALQATVLYEPGSRRRRIAGYKRYAADPDTLPPGNPMTGRVIEVLITPDQIITWRPDTPRDRPEVAPNPAGVVGLVEVVPQPRTIGWPRSELHSAIVEFAGSMPQNDDLTALVVKRV